MLLEENTTDTQDSTLDSTGEVASLESTTDVPVVNADDVDADVSFSDEQLAAFLNEILASSDTEVKFRVDGSGAKVDRDTRAIRGVSLISEGEAKGHNAWVDDVAVQQVATLATGNKRTKVRLGHPGMFKADKFAVAYISNVRLDGGRALADLQFLKSASKVPGLGDVASWFMSLAEEAPELCGMSIVGKRDMKAEGDFIRANIVKDRSGNPRFKSPDARNKNGYYHARFSELPAVDIVDSPAANAKGLFSEGAWDYIVGITDEVPENLASLSAFYEGAREQYITFSEKIGENLKDLGLLDEVDSGEGEQDSESLEDGEASQDTDAPVVEPAEIPQFDSERELRAFTARTVRRAQAEDPAMLAALSIAYANADRLAPWQRDAAAWADFVRLCASPAAKRAELSDEYLSFALMATGFSQESNSVAPEFVAGEIVEQKDTAHDALAALIEQFSVENIQQAVVVGVQQGLRRHAGKLD